MITEASTVVTFPVFQDSEPVLTVIKDPQYDPDCKFDSSVISWSPEDPKFDFMKNILCQQMAKDK